MQLWQQGCSCTRDIGRERNFSVLSNRKINFKINDKTSALEPGGGFIIYNTPKCYKNYLLTKKNNTDTIYS